jgi:chloramphenicol-sensitive protein RarD
MQTTTTSVVRPRDHEIPRAPLPVPAHPHPEARLGLVCGLGAYLAWGIVPMYFKLLVHVPALHVLAHRIVWSAIFLAIVMAVRGRFVEIRQALGRRDVLRALAASTVLIAVNWYVFIYAIETNVVLQASLGYFINPLLSVLLGVVFLRERLRPWQLAGIVLATAGVAVLTISRGQLPWIAIVLAVSFAFYGLLRKTMHVGAMAGLTVETWILFLPALSVITIGWARDPRVGLNLSPGTHLLLALAGIVTAVPLLLFAAGARRLQLSTMGFLQYLSPSCQFLLAVFLYDEPFTRAHLVTFGLIWAALVMYSSDSYLEFRRRGSASAAAAQPLQGAADPPT